MVLDYQLDIQIQKNNFGFLSHTTQKNCTQNES